VFLESVIRDYLLYMQHERSASPATLRSYRYSLQRFVQWLAANGHPRPKIADITASTARHYLYYLNEQGLRPRTRLRLWAPLRALFQMLVQRELIEYSPLEKIALPKKDPAVRLLVSDEELMKVLTAAGQFRAPWRAARDQAILAVLIYTGVRRSEALDLRVGDVDFKRNTLFVAHGKGNKARTVPLCREVREYVQRWLELRPPAEHDWLFSYGPGRKLSSAGLTQLLEHAKALAGYAGAPNIKPHSIRHRTATRLLQNGADLRSVQAWLGHSHLATTAIYLHCDDKRLQSIAHLASVSPVSEGTEVFGAVAGESVQPAPSLPAPIAPVPTPGEAEPEPRERHASDPLSRLRRLDRRRGGANTGSGR
jgi:site-specific recombinase XerD